MSLAFFQKQVKHFIPPVKIICFGAGTQIQGFADQITKLSNIGVEVLDFTRIALKNNIEISRKVKLQSQYSFALMLPLAAGDYGKVNFLTDKQLVTNRLLLTQQITAIVLLCIATIMGMYFYSNYQLKLWNTDYEKSKKQMANVIKDQMDVDIKSSKRVTDIVAAAQEKLEQTKKVCSSFDQTVHNNYLLHLQELCTAIDRQAIGLKLNKMVLGDKEIVLQGKIEQPVIGKEQGRDTKQTAWDCLDIFTQELIQLQGFTLKNIPAELTFNVTLEVKADQQAHKD